MNSKPLTSHGASTASTLLVSSKFFQLLLQRISIYKKNHMAMYLHMLLSDSELGYKLSFLKVNSHKVLYQNEGLDLVRFNFMPLDSDWAHLSLLSFSSGCSRCYLFVYLVPAEKQNSKHLKNRMIY